MSTQRSNKQAFDRVNGWLSTIGTDGRYNRDRIFQSLGIAPAADGTYAGQWGLNDRDRQRVQAAIERELGFQFPGGIEIDPAGNMNENEGFGKQAKKWGPLVGAGALAAFGMPGLFPGLLTGGGAGAAGATGASGAGGGAGTLASSSIPTSLAMKAVPGAIASQGASAALGSMLPTLAGAGTAAATGAAGSAAKGFMGGLKDTFTDPSNLSGLAGVIASLAGGMGGGNGQASADAQRLNQITEQRMRRVDPLHQAVTQLAWGRLPVNARQGIAPPTYQPLP